ncbi:MAG: geranylgeranylglyceryl/heptaprenylglyceryl phosphate synthase [Bacteroidetes bacterium]|nr:geranylgeranylglyceryl/heptaprenylglyceryl phosphate synthase [Bacteroidota bacterium]
MDLLNKLTTDASRGRKKFAVLVDPDKSTPASLKKLAGIASKTGVDYFFFGGSLLMHGKGEAQIRVLRDHSDIPVILFPGSSLQVYPNAQGILLLSLISGRNPDMLIGKHVESAALLKTSKLEILPTGYMLIDSGRPTSVSYISNTQPIPSDKPDIAVCTAIAGEMLGLKLIYMDAGSGAQNPVPAEMIKRVKMETTLPLIVGGGISDPVKAKAALKAGADVIVIGNAIEKNQGLIPEIANVVR